ncbi:MAG TPA: type II toxin-antitoxin system prevent-host-death family antitoxin [Nitrospiraceae bacterium]|nr:type II toxin-antitoxin system prevent-host-death family antitoxin [Nitrospiraceae bacterium]
MTVEIRQKTFTLDGRFLREEAREAIRSYFAPFAGIYAAATGKRIIFVRELTSLTCANYCTYNRTSQEQNMEVVTYSEARANLKDVMDRVVEDKTEVIVTRRKAEAVVMVSLSEWNSMVETAHLLSSPVNAERLRRSIEQMDAGKGTEHDLIQP